MTNGKLVNTLKKPCSEIQRMIFIVENNHNNNYEIIETDTEYQAWNNIEPDDKRKREISYKLDMDTNWFNSFVDGYGEYEQKLKRAEYMGLTETIEDKYREKVYTNLTELYTEAEVVRAEIKKLREELSTLTK